MLIIGGGLSGLGLAYALEAQGEDYHLIEARGRYGGRIKTERLGDGYFDLGPAWFWPDQPRIAALIAQLGLRKFDQFASGDMVFEDETARVQRNRGFSSMEGSWRLHGGLGALIDALSGALPETRKSLNAAVKEITKTETGITATLTTGETFHADHVVLSMPPRTAAKITFTPALPDETMRSLQSVPTWMAGHAKSVAVYDTPFWRHEGLSGDAQSRFGPMVEIHDASPDIGGPYALFGFIGVPPQGRVDGQTLRDHVTEQFVRLFGAQAANPKQLYIKDWAFDPYTATSADHAPLYAHPTYSMPANLSNLWGGQLQISGTEVAPHFGGFLEGALEAAENTLAALKAQKVISQGAN
ncbi:Amine oxidase [Sulfitobacter donghicola DSW-25 = KCTC 12864 = JCM 14565]|nr:Amine oxidase [Sulfitobacter donghicola DSW-25 = KCTC 12864 = JCM 14565]